MKNSLKNQIIELLSEVEKQDLIIFDTYNCERGRYRHNGRIINEQEKEELQKGCKRSIIFSLFTDKTSYNKLVTDKNHLNITIDSPKSAEILLKLRGIKK